MIYTIEYKTGPKTWKAMRTTWAFLYHAQWEARKLDQDGLLINVRIRCSDGKIIKPKTMHDW